MSAIITNTSWKCWTKDNIQFISTGRIAPDRAESLSSLPATDKKIIILSDSIPIASVALLTTEQLIHFLNNGRFDFIENLHKRRDGKPIDAIIRRPEVGENENIPAEIKKITILGLGNVGSTFLQALKLSDNRETGIEEINIYDNNENLLKRWEIEANQITSLHTMHPKVTIREFDQLMDTDLIAFCVAKHVPEIGEEKSSEVRLSQFKANSKILSGYLDFAVKKNFKGIFVVISDPVDHLTRFAIEYTKGKMDSQQFVGLGLGVMYARALYIAKKENTSDLWITGTHGDLVQVINDLENYDVKQSNTLSAKTNEMNLVIRNLGFKPYVAPALSSAFLSIKAMIKGQSFWGAVWNGNIVWGTKILRKNNTWGWCPIGKDISIRKVLIENRNKIDAQYKSLVND